MRRQVFVVVVLATMAAFLTACGAKDDDGGGVASLNGSSSSNDSDGADGDDGDGGDEPEQDGEEAALAFSQCMRENGVPDFPDPEVDGDGGIMLNREGGSNVDREAERKAMEACRDKMPGRGGSFSEEDRAEMQENMLEYAACMREQGIDMPDPTFDGEGGGGPFQMDIDPDDPAFQKAHEACEDTFGGMMRRADG